MLSSTFNMTYLSLCEDLPLPRLAEEARDEEEVKRVFARLSSEALNVHLLGQQPDEEQGVGREWVGCGAGKTQCVIATWMRLESVQGWRICIKPVRECLKLDAGFHHHN